MSSESEEYDAELAWTQDVINDHDSGVSGAAGAAVENEAPPTVYVHVVCFSNANTQGFGEIAGVFNNREAADDCLLRQLNNYREDFRCGLEPTKRDPDMYTHGRDYACIQCMPVLDSCRTE